MDAKEEEDVVCDDAADDDDDHKKKDGAKQKRYSIGLQASSGEKTRTCSFLGSLLRWSNTPQLKDSESSEPGTSKQKEGTPKLSDMQVGDNTPPRKEKKRLD